MVNKQKGIATLLSAVVLLIAVSIISFFAAEVVIRDKQLISNAERGQQAFERAQSGLDFGLAYVYSQGLSSVASASSTSPLSIALPSDLSGGVLSISSNLNSLTITSEAYSDDGVSVRRVIEQKVSLSSGSTSPPSVPVVAKGSASISGNFSVTNNEESLTIWSGEDADLGGSSSTFISIDGNDDQLSTSSSTRGPDVIENDQNLATATEQELLESFFNRSAMSDFCSDSINCSAGQFETWSNFTSAFTDKKTLDVLEDTEISRRVYLKPSVDQGDAECSDNNGFGDWTDVQINDIAPYTSEDNPAVIVVDGNATIGNAGGSTTFYGVIIARKVRITAGFDWQGGVVATNCVHFGGGGVSVELNKTVIESVNNETTQVRVEGSWRDWQ